MPASPLPPEASGPLEDGSAAPRIHPGYLRQLCLKLQHEGVPAARLLAAGRLTMADVFQVDRPLPFDAVRRVLRAALHAAPRPSLALELGREAQLSLLGAIGEAALHAPSVAEGMGVIARYGGQVNPAVRERLAPDGDGVRLHVEPAWPLGDVGHFMLERRTATGLLLLRAISDGPLEGVSVQVPGGAPEWRDTWRPLGVEVRLDGERFHIDIPAAVARRPAAGGSPERHACALAACEAAARGEQRPLAMPDDPSPAASSPPPASSRRT